jgi:hypothetical protein
LLKNQKIWPASIDRRASQNQTDARQFSFSVATDARLARSHRRPAPGSLARILMRRSPLRERPASAATGRKRAQAKGVKFGRKPKLSDYQRKEAIKRRAAGAETLVEIAKSYAVDISMISRL